MEREKFGSRLGFILISAGCAIGLGNVWRFPYIVGKYGGAAFVLIYLVFLLILGLPVMVAEFAVGRASQKSAACSFDVLEPKGTKWHLYKYGAIAGNYLLMMFYTTIAGWMILYFVKMATGQFDGLNSDQVGEAFSHMLGQPILMTVFMLRGIRSFAHSQTLPYFCSSTSTLRFSRFLISSVIAAIKSSRLFAPSSPAKRLLTETVFSSSSFAPTTSI